MNRITPAVIISSVYLFGPLLLVAPSEVFIFKEEALGQQTTYLEGVAQNKLGTQD
jgi:hypothetical protein